MARESEERKIFQMLHHELLADSEWSTMCEQVKNCIVQGHLDAVSIKRPNPGKLVALLK